MTNHYNKYYDKNYFKFRVGNDLKRQASFLIEKKFINQYIGSGKLLDVGCSTGEFINALKWDGETYGMEISKHAVKIARKNGIKFSKNIFNSNNYFDLIIFRGTIQHVDTPFYYLKHAFKALKSGGFVCFLATPNANSIYYKLWNTLPLLDPKINFYIPSDISLTNTMHNYGFTLREIRYPYIHSPYASIPKDHIYFLFKFFGLNVRFPFWRNTMDLIFQKIK